MADLIANENAVLAWGGETPLAPVTLFGSGVQTVSVGGSPILNDSLILTVGSFAPGVGDTTPGIPAGPFIFTLAGSQTVRVGGFGVLREGDESSPVVVTWANMTNSGSPPPRVSTVKCKILSSGQLTVKAS